MKLTVYHGTLPSNTAAKTADQVAANFKAAGVKNVTVDLKPGTPSKTEVLRRRLLPTPHSHLLELRDDRNGQLMVRPTIRPNEAGHNCDFGGYSAVATAAIKEKGPRDDQFITGLANVATHEVAHDAMGHSDKHDFMKGGGASDSQWLFDSKLTFTPGQAQQLQREYNRPGERERQ